MIHQSNQNRVDVFADDTRSIVTTAKGLSENPAFIHDHDALEISLITRCNGTLIIGNDTKVFQEGSISMIAAGTRHQHIFEKNDLLTICGPVIKSVYFRQLTGWQQFMQLPENQWLHILMKKTDPGIL